MTGRADLVWYAAFGSNLWRDRFTTYLTGGPVPHSTPVRIQDGARDPSLPRADATMELPHRLFFTHSSRAWGGGGVAMLDPRPDATQRTMSRLWLITAGQFEDVFRQENGRSEPPTIDLDHVAEVGHLDVFDSWYGRIVHLGDGPEGLPIVTLTCADAEPLPLRPAHPSYLRVVGLGLIEAWDLDPVAVADYLAGRDGNRGTINIEQIITALAEDMAP